MRKLLSVVCSILVMLSTTLDATPTAKLTAAEKPIVPIKLRGQSGSVRLSASLDRSGTLSNIQVVEIDKRYFMRPAIRSAQKLRFDYPFDGTATVFIRMDWLGGPDESRISEISSPDAEIDTGSLLGFEETKPEKLSVAVTEAPIFKAPDVYALVAFEATLAPNLELQSIATASGALPQQFQNRAQSALSRMKFAGTVPQPIKVMITYAWSGQPDGTFGIQDIRVVNGKQFENIEFTPYAATAAAQSSAAQAGAAVNAAETSEADNPGATAFTVSQLPKDITDVPLIKVSDSVLASGKSAIEKDSNPYLSNACLTMAYPYLVSARYWNEVDTAIKTINDAQTGYGSRPVTIMLNRSNVEAVCADQTQRSALQSSFGNDVMAPRSLAQLCTVAGPGGQASFNPAHSSVMQELGNHCLNLDYLRSQEEQACLRTANRTRLRTAGLTMEALCECSGKLRAEYFSYGKTRLSSQSLTRTASTARQVCDNVITAERGAASFR